MNHTHQYPYNTGMNFKKKNLISLLKEIEKIIKILITFFYKKNFKLIINQYSKYNI